MKDRVGHKFKVLHIDADATAIGVGRTETCTAYLDYSAEGWPIVAIAQDDDVNPGVEMAFQESEVEWL